MILYVPWFQEPETKRFLWFRLEELCRKTNRDFQRLILPWDTDKNDEDLFSMSRLESRIQQVIEESKEQLSLVTYSLSSLPTLRAVHNSQDERVCKVKNAIFVQPALDPLYSVMIMDLIRRDWEGLPYSREHFLNSDPQYVFEKLIKSWNGDAEWFQNDLRGQHGEQYFRDMSHEIYNNSWTQVRVIQKEDDAVTNILPIERWRKWAMSAFKSHIPTIDPEEVLKLAA